MQLLKPLIRTSLVLWLLTFLPHVSIQSVISLILAAITFEILFSLVKPILKILFLPINVVTLGLFSALLTLFLLWLVSYLVPGFHIGNVHILGTDLNQFWSLVVTALAISLLQSVFRAVW